MIAGRFAIGERVIAKSRWPAGPVARCLSQVEKARRNPSAKKTAESSDAGGGWSPILSKELET
jgi:hypothetical protein